MKDKVFNLFIILVSLFILISLLIKKTLIYTSIIYALKIWVNSLIPTLFPFFIISDILINYNIIDYIPKIIKDFCKWILGINDNMLIILLLSMISGFPSNARNIRILYDKGDISLEEANHMLIFTHFANPIFILTTVAIFFFNNKRMGIVLIISHYLSNIILGIIFRYKSNINKKEHMVMNNKVNFGIVFINALKRAIDTILMICGILVIFMMLSAIICDIFQFSIYGKFVIKSIFEITIGLQELANIYTIPIRTKAILASQILAFGGISVHVQVLSQITDTKINYHYFLMGRLYQIVISSVITYLFLFIYHI